MFRPNPVLATAALILSLAPAPGIAQLEPIEIGALPDCVPGRNQGLLVAVMDGQTPGDCAIGRGDQPGVCLCKSSGYASALPDLYAALAGANFTGPISVTVNRGLAGDEALAFSMALAEDVAQYWFDYTDSDGDTYRIRLGTDGSLYGLWMQVPGETNPRLYISYAGEVRIDDDDDGVPEAMLTAGSLCFGSTCFFGAAAGPGALPCDASYAGSHYYDNNTENQPCFCNGTAYVLYSDATTACADPE